MEQQSWSSATTSGGYICRDGWSTTEASIVCRQLRSDKEQGCNKDKHFCYSRSLPIDDVHFRLPSNGEILLSGIHCTGGEVNMQACRQHHYKTCAHGATDVATAVCTDSWVSEEIQFKPKTKLLSTPFAGELEVYYGSQFQSLCSGAVNPAAANIMCMQMGFKGGDAEFSLGNSSLKEDWSRGTPVLTSVKCRGSEKRIDECRMSRSRGDCTPQPVRCVSRRCPQTVPGQTGWMEFNGTCYFLSPTTQVATWADAERKMCNFGSRLAKIAKGKYIPTMEEEFVRTWVLMSKMRLEDVWTADSARDATTKKRFVCKVKSSREIRKVHLTGGSHLGEGRLVVTLMDGSEGSVCDDGWDMAAAHVVCRQLGYGRARNISSLHKFGRGKGAIVLDNVQCKGYESQLDHCHYFLNQHNCDHAEDVSVECERGLRPELKINDVVTPLENATARAFYWSNTQSVSMSCGNTGRIEWVYRLASSDAVIHQHDIIGLGDSYGLNDTFRTPRHHTFTCREAMKPDINFTFSLNFEMKAKTCRPDECSIDGNCYAHLERQNASMCRVCDIKDDKNRWSKYVPEKCKKHRKFQESCLPGCDDFNHCTKDDQCLDKGCVGTPIAPCKPCEECYNGACVIKRDYCLINDICYVKGQLNPKPGQSCQYCAPTNADTRRKWTHRQVGARCVDADRCTRNDTCNADGQCVGVSYSGECAHPCLECGDDDACVPRSGFFCAKDGRCGCSINGTCYEEGARNPNNFCEKCNPNFGVNTKWSTVDGEHCDDGDSCTFRDECKAGKCQGTKFTCPKLECIESTICKSTRTEGTCENVYKPPTSLCYVRKDACDYPNTFCTGKLATCPVNSSKELVGRHVNSGMIKLVDQKGARLPRQFLSLFNQSMEVSLLTQTSSVKIEIKGWSVTCGNMTVRAAVFPIFSKIESQKPTSAPLPLKSTGGKAWMVKPLPSGFHDISLSLSPEGMKFQGTYVVQVVGVNIRGLTDSAVSFPFHIDNTPPVFQRAIADIPEGSITTEDIQYSNDVGAMSAYWPANAFVDRESGINRSVGANSFSIGIGSQPLGHDIADFRPCGIERGTVLGVRLRHGKKYYVTVRAKNFAGLYTVGSSNGVLIDTTAPEVKGVKTTFGFSEKSKVAIMNEETLALPVSISSAEDKESGIASIKWQLCFSAPALRCSKASFTEVNCTAFPCSFTATQLPDPGLATTVGLISGQYYQVEIMVTNKAGIHTRKRSPQFLVHFQRPNSVGAVVDDGHKVGHDVIFWTSLTTLDSNWRGFVDAVSGVSHYIVEVVNSKGKTLGTANNVTGTTYTMRNLSFADSQSYKTCVSAVNFANITSRRVCSNGVKIDHKPPTSGKVIDLNPTSVVMTDIDYQPTTSAISTRWTGFHSLSGIRRYEVAIGSTPGMSDVLAFKDVGRSTSNYENSLKLTNGKRYYVTVRATSVSGHVSSATSDGVIPDETPPVSGSGQPICTGTGCGVSPMRDDKMYINTNTALGAKWSGFVDKESGIDHYELNYHYCSQKLEILQPNRRPHFNASSTQGVVNNVGLSHGGKYCATVFAFNRAGAFSKLRLTDGVIVDITKPKVSPFIIHDGLSIKRDRDHQPFNNSISATWTPLNDTDSGMHRQEVSIGSVPGKTDVAGPKRINAFVRQYTFEGLNLPDLKTFYFQVCGGELRRDEDLLPNRRCPDRHNGADRW